MLGGGLLGDEALGRGPASHAAIVSTNSPASRRTPTAYPHVPPLGRGLYSHRGIGSHRPLAIGRPDLQVAHARPARLRGGPGQRERHDRHAEPPREGGRSGSRAPAARRDGAVRLGPRGETAVPAPCPRALRRPHAAARASRRGAPLRGARSRCGTPNQARSPGDSPPAGLAPLRRRGPAVHSARARRPASSEMSFISVVFHTAWWPGVPGPALPFVPLFGL